MASVGVAPEGAIAASAPSCLDLQMSARTIPARHIRGHVGNTNVEHGSEPTPPSDPVTHEEPRYL